MSYFFFVSEPGANNNHATMHTHENYSVNEAINYAYEYARTMWIGGRIDVYDKIDESSLPIVTYRRDPAGVVEFDPVTQMYFPAR